MFKDKLKELREKSNISQYQLADKIYVSRSAIAKWENGLGMPSSDSLDMLCSFFNVSKEDLLNENDANVVLTNVEKKSKKIIRALIIFLSVALTLFFGTGIYAFVQIKMEEPYQIHQNKYYSEKYLAEYELDGLPMIDNSEHYMFGINNSFTAFIDSYEIFDNYANYVYNKLKHSIYISYLSTSYCINGTYSLDSRYLITTEKISDHIEGIVNNKPTTYTFYYFTDINKDRNIKDSVDAKYVKLEYFYNGSQHVFQMDIDNTKNQNYNYNFYLAHEYFVLDKVNLDNRNFSDFFDVAYVSDGIIISPKEKILLNNYFGEEEKSNPFFRVFVNTTFKLLNIHDFDILETYVIQKSNLLDNHGLIIVSYNDFKITDYLPLELEITYFVENYSVLYLLNPIAEEN